MSDYDPPTHVGIGTRLWVYEQFRERRDPLASVENFASGWREHEIAAETRVSWIVRAVGSQWDVFKIAKKTLTSKARIRWSLDDIATEYADALWRQANVSRIERAIWFVDVPTLRKVAALIDYEESK